jgi:DNA-binding SARP family transcriptional activator
MADVDLEQARSFATAGEALLEQVPTDDAIKFIHYATRLDFMVNDFRRAEAGIERALALIPKDAPKLRRLSLLTNLAVMRWYRVGDLEGQQKLLEETLTWEGVPALQLGIMHWNLGMNYHLFNMNAQALEQFRQTQRFEAVRPVQALQARAMELILERIWHELPAVMARLSLWEQPGIEDRIRASWAMALLNDGQAEVALEHVATDTPYSRIARAQVMNALGEQQEALSTLETMQQELQDRDLELHWVAARYVVSHDPQSLERFLGLTTSGARLLPHFVPLTDLPRNRPELVDPYPLFMMLRSGWKDAIKRRHAEIPPLEVHALGRFEVRVLGNGVSLTQRPREIVLLSLLGETREAITETIWPDLEPEKMRNNLHFNVNALRKALEPWGVPTYLFEHGLERVYSDLHDLDNALKRNDAEAVSRLYQGDLAPGVDLPRVDEARENLRLRVIECLYHNAEGSSSDQAVMFLERLLEIDPLHEDALRALLSVLVSQGRRRTAERRYQEFSRRLRDTMGLEPSMDTRKVLS